MERLETGIPGLDALGGLPKGRTTLLTGTTGSGKTVFALQFLAAGVTSFGQPGVLVTLEEPAEELIANMGSFGWDLAGLVDSGRIAVVDATDRGEEVVSGGFDFGGLSARIANAIKDVGAKRLVVDPLDVLFLDFGEAREVRKALQGVVRALRPLGVTTVMTAERSADFGPYTRFGAEEFVAANLVVLRNSLEEERRRRTLEVVKFRGYQHRKGEFPFVIDPVTGIEVVPFSVIEGERDEEAASDRISLGPPLDDMCGGGVYRDSVVLVTGATGTGKTLLGAQFTQAGLDAGERVLFLSFEESASQISRNAHSWGMDFAAPEVEGRLRIVSRYPERMGLQDLLVEIRREVEEFRPGRVVIDSMTALMHNAPAREFREFGVGLSGYFKRRGVAALMTTTLLTLFGGESATGVALSTVADAIVALRYLELEGELRRGIAVVKLRGQAHDRTIQEYEITDHGIRVLGPFDGVSGIFAGRASFLGGTHPTNPAGDESGEPGGV
ncbi:MAG: circadian clock protein KaiC [Solirubrobacteraceae bacterium]